MWNLAWNAGFRCCIEYGGGGGGGGGYLARVRGYVAVQEGVTVSSNTDSQLIENNSETSLSVLLPGRKEVLDK